MSSSQQNEQQPPSLPKITAITPLSNTTAKWTNLKLISFLDAKSTPRTWEMVTRSTRGSSGVDAVAIGNILVHPTRPPSTVLVIQYRPPMDAFTVEWPAGLIDQNETPEEAALRELKEETGYVGKVISVGPTVASDPGLTNANIKLVMVEVELGEGELRLPQQSLDDGEDIVRVVVPLSELYDRLVEYSNTERMVVAAKLFHFAAGMRFAKEGKYV